MLQLVLLSLVGGLFSLIGGIFLLFNLRLAKKIITILLSFAAGAFLTTAFIDIIPEAVEMVEEPHPVFFAVLAGFTIFFIAERALMTYKKRDAHEHSEHTESLAFLVILGDIIHNFLDGVLIAIAFIANPALGLATAIGIAAHEIPQEIADFSILISNGWKKSSIILVNILQSLMTIPGALLGFYASQYFVSQMHILLGIAGGIFIYISASDLIPELHHKSGHNHFFRIVTPFLASILLVSYLIISSHA